MEFNQESDLLRRVADGDTTAFALLFDAYHHSLGNFIFGITKSRETAEEVTMDVFLKIWMAREALVEVKNFKAYIFTISRNAAISQLRKALRERTNEMEWIRQPSIDNADFEIEKEAYLSIIDEAIEQLSPNRKKIYLLSRQQGLKYEEIANQLGISRFTVRSTIQQAVESIVQYVKERTSISLVLLLILADFL